MVLRNRMPPAADIAQNGGAAIAMGSALLGYSNSTMYWLNSNSAGILALCCIGGLVISIMGFIVKRKHMKELVASELRMKQCSRS